MIKILKYELRRRRNTIITLTGIMAGLAIGSLILSGLGYDLFGMGQNSTFNLWNALTFIALLFIPGISFFTCSNGHIDELLYKDTNYLMLTIPLKSHKILLGRILAGFVEFLIYTVVSFIFMMIIMSLQISMYSTKDVYYMANEIGSSEVVSFFEVLGTLLKNIFILNPLPLLYVIFSGISFFLLIGTLFMFVKALTRSFIRKPQLAQLITIILFILIFSRVIKLGIYLSEEWNLVQYLDIKLVGYANGMYSLQSGVLPVYLVTAIFTLLIAGGFFAITNWLFSKKVEL